jgi:hypothetical protein
VRVRGMIGSSGGSRIFFFFLGGLKNVFPWDIFYNIAVID